MCAHVCDVCCVCIMCVCVSVCDMCAVSMSDMRYMYDVCVSI